MAEPDRPEPARGAGSGVDLTQRLDEQLLIARVRASDPLAFEAIFRRYHRELCAVAEAITGSGAAAEDVVQDVFVAVWSLRERWHVKVSLSAYLRRATKRAAHGHTRGGFVKRAVPLAELVAEDTASADRGTMLVDGAPSPHEETETGMLAAQIEAAVNALTPRPREVYRLSREQGLSIPEIAARLEISRKTAEMHLTRALAALRRVRAKWVDA